MNQEPLNNLDLIMKSTMRVLKTLMIILALFAVKTGSCQSLNDGFNYRDNTSSNKQIRIEISKMLATVDSVETANNFHARVVYHMALYFIDSSNISRRWKQFQNKYSKELIKKVGRENVVIHSAKILDRNRSLQKDQLSVGPVFVAD